jgi:hypothetical protein
VEGDYRQSNAVLSDEAELELSSPALKSKMSDHLRMSENWGREGEDPNWEEEAQKPPSSQEAGKLLEDLSSGDDMEVLQVLSRLAEELSMVQEDAISSYPIPQLVPILVQCLQRDSIPDVMLYSINCIVNLLDLLPNLARAFATAGAVPAICAKLSSFEFVDLAESAVKALEKLGYEHGSAILREGVLSTLVELVYFFDTETQKRIMRVLTMLASAATNQELFIQFVEPALPSLLPHLSSDEGSPLTELALRFFHVLIDSVKESHESPALRTDSLCERGLLTQLMDLLQSRLDLTAQIFGVLDRLAASSANAAEILLNLGITNIIAQSLSYDKEAVQFKQSLGLINSLLPEQSAEDYGFRMEFYRSNPQFVDSIGGLVIPRVLSSFDKIDQRSVKSLKAFDSLMQLGSVECLAAEIDPAVLASFVQELLHSSDRAVLEHCLSIVSVTYNKLPSQFITHFVREGVIEKLRDLSQPQLETDAEQPRPKKAKLAQPRASERSTTVFGQVTSRAQGQMELGQQTPEAIEIARERVQTELGRATYTAPRSMSRELASDAKGRSSEDISNSANLCLQLHERLGEPSESSILVQLTAISGQIESGEAVLGLEEMRKLLEAAEGVTSSEVFKSNLPSALLNWLSADPSNSALLKEACPQSSLTKLVKLLVLTLKFTSSFAIQVRESRGSPGHAIASLASPAALSISFHGEASDDLEVTEKQEVFCNNQEFHINVPQFLTLDAVAEKLLAVTKQAHLESLSPSTKFIPTTPPQLKQPRKIEGLDVPEALRELGISEAHDEIAREVEAQHRHEVIEQMIKSSLDEDEVQQEELASHIEEAELVGQPMSSLQVEFLLGGKVIPNCTYISSIAPAGRGEERVLLDFTFLPKQQPYSIEYIDASHSFLQTIAESCEVGLPRTSEVYPTLSLLKLLSLLNTSLTLHIPTDAFYSAKLSAAVAKQSEEAVLMLTDTAPEWVTRVLTTCQFLFPFDLRHSVLKRTNFTGHAVQQALSAYQGRTKVVAVGKRKFTVKRSQLLTDALRIFSDTRVVRPYTLEFDYAEEEGTGLGPTLEFYYLLSQEIRGMQIWRNTGELTGLFPAPSSKEDFGLWETLGRIIGKAFADDRLLELPLSPVLWRLIFRQPIRFADLAQVDPILAAHMTELLTVSRPDTPEFGMFRGVPVADLLIEFTLPGYDCIELKPEGSLTLVTADNLSEYVELVAATTLMQTSQAEAMRCGLRSIIDLSKLEFLTSSELETVLCGSNDEDWEQSAVLEALVAAHGYSKTSTTFLNLISAMQDFTDADRRLFLSFITGSPRLPIGGFKALSPALTVVRKDPSLPGGSPDDYMPSVMTCQNYLKLPDYSSAAVLRKSLHYAIQEGRETFHFS